MQDVAPTAKRTSGWLAVAGFAGLGALAAMSFGRMRKLRRVSPDLRSAGLMLMPPIAAPLIPMIRHATRRRAASTPVPDGVAVSVQHVRGAPGAPDVRVMTVARAGHAGTGPALLWLHGGGYVIGTPEMDLPLLARIVDRADIRIFSVDYRLAPHAPYPAALDDAMAALRWIVEGAAVLGVDPRRIAIGGNSAGGGLAAALAQRACDEGMTPAFQLLMYPMLDDRTVGRGDRQGRGELVWTPRNNRHGWAAYLGHPPCRDDAPSYAAPARREQLGGLPPAWIGVGTLDLFHDEDVAYAERLRAAGVPCALAVVADAPHAFDLFNFESRIARHFHDGMISALLAAYAKITPTLP